MSVADFLQFTVVAESLPMVVAGAEHLGALVSRLYVLKSADPGEIVSGGALVLTTVDTLPREFEATVSYADKLLNLGVVALAVQVRRPSTGIPSAIVRAFENRRLPLIALHREVSFLDVVATVESTLASSEREVLELMNRVHDRFTQLGLADASLGQLVSATAELAGGQVVFANLVHQVLAVEARGESQEELIAKYRSWEPPTSYGLASTDDPAAPSLAVPVGVRGRRRGWVVLYAPGPLTRGQVLVLERASAALAMRMLTDTDEGMVDSARNSLLTDIVTRRFDSVEQVHARAAALGHATRGRRYLPVVVLATDVAVREWIEHSLERERIEAVHGPLLSGRWGVMLLLPGNDSDEAADRFARQLHDLGQKARGSAIVVGRGAIVGDLREVPMSFREAADVAIAGRSGQIVSRWRACYRSRDVQLRGLLYTLRDDPRVQTFAQRTVGALVTRDSRDGSELVGTLAVYLRLRGNKSLAAQDLGISRPTLYERLGRIQRLLDMDLDDPETSTSLYAAIMVIETTATRPTPLDTVSVRRSGR
ncbi:MAG: PucR family transcriptional regulator ligand-binding domain-containing protein [Microbacterium sp.]|nr:PucR family transcriptional regulator ligand-binding domain-containing protein [Microbacterium sp.]